MLIAVGGAACIIGCDYLCLARRKVHASVLSMSGALERGISLGLSPKRRPAEQRQLNEGHAERELQPV